MVLTLDLMCMFYCRNAETKFNDTSVITLNVPYNYQLTLLYVECSTHSINAFPIERRNEKLLNR